MDQPDARCDGRGQPLQQPDCEAELHLRLCARRLTSGHLQFLWRVEHVDRFGESPGTMTGTFAPFLLPHEGAQLLGGMIRQWLKDTPASYYAALREAETLQTGAQLTLGGDLAD
jgi:hypothetical protein